MGALRQAQGERNCESALRGVGVFVVHGAQHLDLTLEVGLLAVDEEGVDEEGYPRYRERDEEEREKALPLGLFRAERREQGAARANMRVAFALTIGVPHPI